MFLISESKIKWVLLFGDLAGCSKRTQLACVRNGRSLCLVGVSGNFFSADLLFYLTTRRWP